MDALARPPSPLPLDGTAPHAAPDEAPFAFPGSPIAIAAPPDQTAPLVLASPHSGDIYPPEFLAASRLDPLTLRRSEDAYVHDLVAAAPRHGAPLLAARFPRAFLDPNREPYELDPAMFDGPLPRHANTRSPRVAAGLGTIARLVAAGTDIYAHRLPVAEVERRISSLYRPYHAALRALVEDTRHRFGFCVLLDCHSMPSGLLGQGGGSPLTGGMTGSGLPGSGTTADFVLGDCHGVSCGRAVVETVQAVLVERGHRVARNAPYAGGFTTRHYGRPLDGVHALQIEVNRRLYMNEATYERLPGFAAIAATLEAVIAALAALPAQRLRPPRRQPA